MSYSHSNGPGESLTFHITPFVLDFFKHGEREVDEIVCLIIFTLVSLMNNEVLSLREKGVKAVVLSQETSKIEVKDTSAGKYKKQRGHLCNNITITGRCKK